MTSKLPVLVADDDRLTRTIVARTLSEWDFDVRVAADGREAWTQLVERPPSLAILDWVMPDIDGLDLCRRIRADGRLAHVYVVMVSSREGRANLLTGLEAGADDYMVKPLDRGELRARVNVGLRILGLRHHLAEQVARLEAALANVRQLQGLLPICAYCKRIRSDDHYWEQIETYITQHSDAQFSHGICPACLDRVVKQIPRLKPRSRAVRSTGRAHGG